VQLDGRFNAGFGRVGLGRRRVLQLGLPMWDVLAPQPKVALIAHELSHEVNGDPGHGIVVGSAMRTLDAWQDMLRPAATRSRGIVALAEWMVEIVGWPVRRAIGALKNLAHRLHLRDRQRAELRADELAATVSSTRAMIDVLDTMIVGVGCVRAVQLARQHGSTEDDRAIERAYLSALPAHERERLRRRDRLRGQRVDSTHPPTTSRIDVLATRPPHPASVVLDPGRDERITAEMRAFVRAAGDEARRTATARAGVALPGLGHPSDDRSRPRPS
jgi:hypothetical protein